MYKVYLSGPIAGLSFDESIKWTEYAESELNNVNIKGYKPLRGKWILSDRRSKGLGYDVNPLSTQKGIFTRDLYDVRSSDVILVNLLGAKRVSIGTIWEMSAAYENKKPIVLVMEKEGNLHHGIFPIEASGHWAYDLDTGIDIVKSILLQ